MVADLSSDLTLVCVDRCMNTTIRVLPTDLASGCPLLTTMAFNQSSIQTVETQALANLPQLQAMYV